jgi:hypothetical protein
MKELIKMNFKSIKYISIFLLLDGFCFSLKLRAEGGGDKKGY